MPLSWRCCTSSAQSKCLELWVPAFARTTVDSRGCIPSHPEIRRRDRLARERRRRRLRAPRGPPAGNRRAAAALSACTMSCSTITSEMPFGQDRRQPRIDLAHHDRGEPEADLVAQEEPSDSTSARGRSRPSAAGRPRAPCSACAGARRAPERARRCARASTAPARPSWPPIRRFSSTVSEGKSPLPSGTSAMPRAATACAGRPPIGAPSNTIASRRASASGRRCS